LEVTPEATATLEIPMHRRRVSPANDSANVMRPAGMGMWALMAPDWN
ncbi:MAG: hypothetical protein ACI9KE_003866, partial [Polyangiales bacterium]